MTCCLPWVCDICGRSLHIFIGLRSPNQITGDTAVSHLSSQNKAKLSKWWTAIQRCCVTAMSKQNHRRTRSWCRRMHKAVLHGSNNGNHKHYRASSRLGSAFKWLMYNKCHCLSTVWLSLMQVWVFALSTDYAGSLFELHLINACLMRSSGHMVHGCSLRDMSNKIIRSRRVKNLAFIFTW